MYCMVEPEPGSAPSCPTEVQEEGARNQNGSRRERCLQIHSEILRIHVTSLSTSKHQNQEEPVLDLVDHPVVPNTQAVKILLSLQLLHPVRSGVSGERFDPGNDPPPVIARETSQFLLGRGPDEDLIRHGLEPQLFLELGKPDVLPLFLEGFTGCFEVHPILDFLKESSIRDGDKTGEILAMSMDNDSFPSESDLVEDRGKLLPGLLCTDPFHGGTPG
jgi:hypothetical protein